MAVPAISLYPTLTVAAFLTAVAALPLLNRMALGIGWVDKPDERKVHHGTIPLTGGLAVVVAVAVSVAGCAALRPEVLGPMDARLLSWPMAPWPFMLAGLTAGLIACFLVGFWDDRYPLQARYRLLAQAFAALLAAAAGNALHSMGTTFSPVPLGLALFALPVTVVALAGVANAWNMSDGLDGLCGGYAVVALVAFAGCARLVDADARSVQAFSELGPVILPFLGGVAGFLVYNLRHPWRERAASFLGDAGSMSLGFLVGWVAVRLASGYGPSSMPPVVAVWIVCLPLVDMFSCMIRRPFEGRTPMSADRRHLHHLLMAHGLSVRQTVFALHALAATGAATGIAAWRIGVPSYVMFWTLVSGFVGYTVFAILYWRRRDAQPEPVLSAPARVVASSGGLGT